MEDSNTLLPGVGFGRVRFGMTLREVTDLIGKPTELERDVRLGADADDLSTEAYYEGLALSLSFDKLYDYRLTDVMTEDECRLRLPGGLRLGDSVERALEVALANDWGPGEQPDEGDLSDDERAEFEEREMTELDFEEKGMILWFERGQLTTIQLGPVTGEGGDPIWPDKN